MHSSCTESIFCLNKCGVPPPDIASMLAVFPHRLRMFHMTLQCECCSKLECVAVCWSAFAVFPDRLRTFDMMLRCECCIVLQCVAVCCSVLQCVALCCSVLQRVDCISSSPVYVGHDVAV